VVLFVGNQPEDYGLTVENEPVGDENGSAINRSATKEISFTLQEALRTTSFWFAGIISMLPSMFTTGLTFHFFNIMAERNVSEQQAAFTIGLIAFPAFFIPLIARSVIDRYPVRHILKATVFFMMVSMVFLMFGVTGQTSATLFILFYGTAIAVQAVSLNVLWPNYFGRTYLGSIRSVATVFMVLGSALGPVPFGLSYDLTGKYNWAILVSLLFALVTFVLSFYVSAPIKHSQAVID
jgi:MFS family permease